MWDFLLVFQEDIQHRLAVFARKGPIIVMDVHHQKGLQAIMAAVANGAALARLAAAKSHPLGIWRNKIYRLNAGAFVRVVAKGCFELRPQAHHL